MTDKLKSDYALGGLLWLVAGEAGNWLITPASHPGASTFRYVGVWVQLIVCAIAGWRLMRKAQSPASAS